MAHWTAIIFCLLVACNTSFGDYVCPTDWQLMSTGDQSQCIQVVAARVNWSAAKLACQANGGQLASVHNAFENTFINQQLAQQKITSAWLGGIIATPAANDTIDWFWVDGTDFQSYMNWKKGEPDTIADCGPNLLEQCLTIRADWSGQWNDFCCGSSSAGVVYGYVCAKNAQNLLL
uniref:C-type lectin domain-containing protein n=1 Tax=Plectus sambesii TaxID=2011161 RepID=A0A914W033_9BILA